VKSLVASGVLSCLVAFATGAHALPFAPQIDFRDSNPWSGANNQASFNGSQAGVSLSLDPNPNPATLWWDNKDGLGVRRSYENDEIESDEILKVSFDMPVELTAIYISDLFHERGYFEEGSYSINGATWVDFDASSLPGSNDNGERMISFANPVGDVSYVEFTAPGRINGENHEFALMGFDVIVHVPDPIPVPEPGTGLLLGLGLVLFGAGARRVRRG
jgi:hypothetical protein